MVEIRNDDVLQVGYKTVHQGYYCKDKDMFELFLKADEPFQKYNYPCTLAILAEGVDVYPEWVKHIKNNSQRYTLELHGYHHEHYNILSREEGKLQLQRAVEKIEDKFQTKLTTWYVPFGRRRWPDWGKEVAEELGLRFDPYPGKIEVRYWLMRNKQGYPFEHTNFHFWHPAQAKAVKEILCLLNESKSNSGSEG